MHRATLLVLLAALVAAFALVPAAAQACPARDGAPRAVSGTGTAASAGRAAPRAHASAGRRRAARVRKRARSRRWGHVPAWVLIAGAFAAPAPGTTPAPVPTDPGTTTPPDPGTTPPGTTPPATPTCNRAVGAREGEWFVTLSRTKLCSGLVTIEAQNYGTDAHDLRIQHEGGPQVETWPELAPGSPGGVLAKKVTLTPGRYTLYCSLVGGTPPGTPGESHAAAGMTATLTIVAP